MSGHIGEGRAHLWGSGLPGGLRALSQAGAGKPVAVLWTSAERPAPLWPGFLFTRALAGYLSAGIEAPEGRRESRWDSPSAGCERLQQRLRLPRPGAFLLELPSFFPGRRGCNGKRDLGAPAGLRGWLLARQPQPGRAARRQGGDAAESAPAARGCGRRGGNKGSTCLGGAAGGFGPRPRPRRAPSRPPPGPSSAARGAGDSHAAGRLLARRRRAGGERCGRGGPERRGGAGAASTRRHRPSPGPGWGAASRDARARGRIPARTARGGWR